MALPGSWPADQLLPSQHGSILSEVRLNLFRPAEELGVFLSHLAVILRTDVR